ncbi:hypothetical protein [Deinococcus multiflagellatus]|uniref:Uncharacterized protein n=1 Tax=Deinococcus multiflagellatus TaxID=1656887 RepID=A0ABW1ZG46_9DEIO|nr:hypothetical protein [Deinococcus multiflagellatus]MBZ9712196.1 hypothetical protein [Deinococcus multiflagellatus]
MIKMTWEKGELDDRAEGIVVETTTSWARVGERAIVEFDVPYGTFDGQPRSEESSGEVIRFPDRGNATHRIPYPAVETGMPPHLLIDLD